MRGNEHREGSFSCWRQGSWTTHQPVCIPIRPSHQPTALFDGTTNTQFAEAFFSGFVLVKIPFALTASFKGMLQRGVELSYVDPHFSVLPPIDRSIDRSADCPITGFHCPPPIR